MFYKKLLKYRDFNGDGGTIFKSSLDPALAQARKMYTEKKSLRVKGKFKTVAIWLGITIGINAPYERACYYYSTLTTRYIVI